MTRDEMHSILSKHLDKFREWSYERLAECIERNRKNHDCLDHVEGEASDGIEYQIEFNIFWDDRPKGDIRVSGSLAAEPQRPLLGFIPIYTPDMVDDFIMNPDGHFIDEDENLAEQATHQLGSAAGASAPRR